MTTRRTTSTMLGGNSTQISSRRVMTKSPQHPNSLSSAQTNGRARSSTCLNQKTQAVILGKAIPLYSFFKNLNANVLYCTLPTDSSLEDLKNVSWVGLTGQRLLRIGVSVNLITTVETVESPIQSGSGISKTTPGKPTKSISLGWIFLLFFLRTIFYFMKVQARAALLLRTGMSIFKDDRMSPLFQEAIVASSMAAFQKNGYWTKNMDIIKPLIPHESVWIYYLGHHHKPAKLSTFLLTSKTLK